MADLVTQPSALPTRKVFIGALAGLVTAAVQSWAADAAATVPQLSWLGGDVATAALPILVGYGVSYVIKDRAV